MFGRIPTPTSPIAIPANLFFTIKSQTGSVVGRNEFTGNPVYEDTTFEAKAFVTQVNAPRKQDVPGLMAAATYLRGYILNGKDMPSTVQIGAGDRIPAKLRNTQTSELQDGEFLLQTTITPFASAIAQVSGIAIEGYWQVLGGFG